MCPTMNASIITKLLEIIAETMIKDVQHGFRKDTSWTHCLCAVANNFKMKRIYFSNSLHFYRLKKDIS
jgi:hypothetical protein